MSDPAAASNPPLPIAGVRLPGQRRLTFALCEPAAPSGSGVLIWTEEGERSGVVVLASTDVLEYHGPPPTARIIRCLRAGERLVGAAHPPAPRGGRAVLDSLQLPAALLEAHGLASDVLGDPQVSDPAAGANDGQGTETQRGDASEDRAGTD